MLHHLAREDEFVAGHRAVLEECPDIPEAHYFLARSLPFRSTDAPE